MCINHNLQEDQAPASRETPLKKTDSNEERVTRRQRRADAGFTNSRLNKDNSARARMGVSLAI